MAKFIVKDITIRHDGKDYPVGSTIDLSKEEAAQLAKFLETQDKQPSTGKEK